MVRLDLRPHLVQLHRPADDMRLLRPAFFAEVNDNARVALTFHFWSGTRVTYFVTKSGSTVTGSTS